jgi:glutathione S-transferase
MPDANAMTPLKLINAKPSPFGRKVIIALREKGLPYEVQWDIPWHEDTCVGDWNPLQQLPILISGNGEVVYESSYILEWLETRFPSPPLVPDDPEDRLTMGRFRVLAVTVMDSIVRINFELARPAEQQSGKFLARYQRKITGGIRAIGRMIDGKPFAVGNRLSHADLEVGSVLGHLDFLIDAIAPLAPSLLTEGPWRSLHPCLDAYVAGLEARPSFKGALREMVQMNFKEVVG